MLDCRKHSATVTLFIKTHIIAGGRTQSFRSWYDGPLHYLDVSLRAHDVSEASYVSWYNTINCRSLHCIPSSTVVHGIQKEILIEFVWTRRRLTIIGKYLWRYVFSRITSSFMSFKYICCICNMYICRKKSGTSSNGRMASKLSQERSRLISCRWKGCTIAQYSLQPISWFRFYR